jgi:exodeoxyribonuclease VII small subunit
VKPGELGYAEMVAELEAILRDLDAADIDVDVLAERVARAAWLVEACRQRIDEAQPAVQQVVARVDAAAGAAEG